MIGRPNAGKSSFLNALIWEKVSIISPRPQTTQRTIMGIYNDDATQIVFLDTPGIHEWTNPINTAINHQAFRSLHNADIILVFLDPTRPHGREDDSIKDILRKVEKPVIRVETKWDIPSGFPHTNIDVRISAVTHEGFETLLSRIREKLPEGESLFEEDFYTIQERELRIGEIIREELFEHLREEIPYSCYVEVTEIEENTSLLKAMAYINTETESQKSIVIGRGGAVLQAIGTGARTILEAIFGKKIHLALRVKVEKNWRKNPEILDRIFPKK